MSKSYKNQNNSKFGDEISYNLHKQGLREHRKEKRIINAVRSKNIEDLMDLDDDEI